MNNRDEMTLLHVCDYCPSYKGNFISSLEALDGHEGVRNVYLFPFRSKDDLGTMAWIEDLNRDGIIAYVQKKGMLSNLFLLNKIIRKHEVDVICRHFNDFKIDVIIKVLFNSCKVLRFFHCGYTGASARGIKHKIRGFVWGKNTLIGVSEVVSEELREAFPKFKVVTIENGIHFPRLDGTSRFDFGCKNPVIACMGYSVMVKGVDLALLAMRKMRLKYDLNLNIIAAARKDELVAFIKKTFGSFPDWIRILPPTTDMGSYYRGIDILLAPSRTEAFSYTVVEAAYCERSIVASRVGGQAKLDIDGIYWFEKEDVEGLAMQLEKAIVEFGTDERRKKLAEVSETVKVRYSLDNWRKTVIEAISTLRRECGG